MRSAFLVALLTAAVAACASDDLVDQQADFSTDSFANPTDHGELVFGVPTDARFDAEHRFHSWTFTLTDTAEIDLRTSISTTNLDTVMYLYRRQGAEQNWGSYIEKNDDYDGELAARIMGSFDAGEYRIKVKALKPEHHGNWSIKGTCDGAGCPPVDECLNGYPFPVNTPFTDGCATRMGLALVAETQSSDDGYLRFGEHCERGEIVAKAIDYAKDYYDDIGVWEAWEEYVPDGELFFEAFDKGNDGAVARVHLDGAEPLTFVFDSNSDLMAYMSGASFIGWTCGKAGETSVAAPEAECIDDAVWGLTHEANDAWDDFYSVSTNDMLSGEADLLAERAMIEFCAERGLDHDVVLDVNVEHWTGLAGYVDYVEGAYVTVAHEDVTSSYSVTQVEGKRIITRDAEEGMSFLCKTQ